MIYRAICIGLASFGGLRTKHDFLHGILYLQNVRLCIYQCYILLIHQSLPKNIVLFLHILYLWIFLVLYLAALRSEQWNQSNASGIEASPFEDTQLSQEQDSDSRGAEGS